MLTVPLVKLAVGVNTAVRTRPVVLSVPRVPPDTTTSLEVKLLKGSSLKVKVMLAVPPALTAETLDVMATDGATVSMLMAGDVPALPLLPGTSW